VSVYSFQVLAKDDYKCFRKPCYGKNNPE
jgi:hypothetical protein